MNNLCATVTVFLAVALVSDATETGRCDLPVVTGPCRAGHQRWGYADGECSVFTYGGCEGNANNFASEGDCKQACICTQPQVVGPCRGSHKRWAFSGSECTSFLYGGCKGNQNNFMTEEECQDTCS